MAIIETVTSQGANVTSSLSGALTINEANGEIVIRNGTTEVVRIDKNGFKYYDNSGTQRISFGQNSSGQQQILVYDKNGIPIVLVGQNPKDSTPVVAVAESGTNVLTALQND